MKIKVAWIGKTKEPAIESLTGEYLKRLSRQAPVEAFALKDEAALLALGGRDGRSKEKHTLILLDRRGKQHSSEELAKFIDEYQSRTPLPLIFAIGPADGFSEETRKTANLMFSFGKMTLPHELARIILLEQLYRAFTILKGHPYHSGH